jgi:catalase
MLRSRTVVAAGTLVDVIVAQFGGAHRPVHSDGIGVQGTFTATPEATSLSRASHLAGSQVPVAVRFSDSSGVPESDERRGDVRGMATRFHLSDGTHTDLLAMTLPVFFVRTPEDFMDFSRVNVPNPATGVVDRDAVLTYLAEHPEATAAFQALAAIQASVDASYAGCTFHAVHAFGLLSAAGDTTWVRLRWRPTETISPLTPQEAVLLTHDHLRRDIASRMRDGRGARFDLVMQIASDSDDLTDCTQAWPDDRTELIAGHLELGALVTDQYANCEGMAYDPTNVVDGVICSADPVLTARGAAYPVSASRRRAAYSSPS